MRSFPGLLAAFLLGSHAPAQTAVATLDDDFGDSYKATVTVTNDTPDAISGWRVRMQLGGPVSSLWRGIIEAGESDPASFAYAVRNESYNGDLAPGESTHFGMIVDPDNGSAPPTGITVEIITGDGGSGGSTGGTPPEGGFNHAEALQKSLWFFDAQRSGNLPPDFRVGWRGDSGLTDGSDVGLDLSGGFHDAGDHVKFGLPMAFSMTLLAWGAIEYPEAYADVGQLDELRDLLRWGADYLMRCHVRTPTGETSAFYGQVGDPALDHAFWGPAEAMTMARPAFRVDATAPGSDLAGETAAALAASAMVLAGDDPTLAAEMIEHAESLHRFADTHRGKYSDSIPTASPYYTSSGYLDELAWGALWLYRATGRSEWLDEARAAYDQVPGAYDWTLSWDDKSYGCHLLKAIVDRDADSLAKASAWLDYWTTGHQGQQVAITPGGLAFLSEWGSLRYAANTAFCALVHADRIGDPDDRYSDFARAQIDYLLGTNPAGRSYVCGFGTNPPVNPHHRSAHGSTTNDIHQPTDNLHILYGAMVGGPDANDGFADDRTDFQKNEVALDYNAGLTGALARLSLETNGSPAPGFGGPSGPDILFHEDLDGFPAGDHDDDSWIPRWPGTKWANGPDEGRLAIDDRTRDGSGRAIRVLYPQGGQQSANSGAQWFIDLNAPHEELYLSYWVRFDEDFDFVLGGKLPGFGGAVSFDDRTHEWSGRLMWREAGKIEFYVHVPSDNLYDPGDRFWWNTEGFQAFFEPGRWHHIEIRMRLNTPGEFDGLMEGWLDGVKAASYPGFYFRDAPTADATLAWVFFSTFFGGSSSSIWQATKDEHAWFDEFTVSRSRRGYPGPPSDADADGLPDAWEVMHFSSAAGTPDDRDGDGWTDLDELVAGTDPSDPLARPRTVLENGQLTVAAQPGRQYLHETSADLSTWQVSERRGPLAVGASLRFEAAPEDGSTRFHRVRIERP